MGAAAVEDGYAVQWGEGLRMGCQVAEEVVRGGEDGGVAFAGCRGGGDAPKAGVAAWVEIGGRGGEAEVGFVQEAEAVVGARRGGADPLYCLVC